MKGACPFHIPPVGRDMIHSYQDKIVGTVPGE